MRAGTAAVDPGKPAKTAEAEAEADPQEGAEFAQPAVKQSLIAADPTAADADRLAGAAQPLVDDLIAGVSQLVDAAEDLGELQTALLDAYGDLDTGELTRLMAAAFALAELKGMAAVRGEVTGLPVAFAESPPAPPVFNLAATINLPEGLVKVDVQPAALPEVKVENLVTLPEAPAPVVHNAIHVPEAPAPVVQNTVNLPETAITLNLPPRKTETVVVRDGQGNIARATQIETDINPSEE